MKSCPFCSNSNDDNAVQCIICGYMFHQMQPYYRQHQQNAQQAYPQTYQNQHNTLPQQSYSHTQTYVQHNQQGQAFYSNNEADINFAEQSTNSKPKLSWIKIILFICILISCYTFLNSLGLFKCSNAPLDNILSSNSQSKNLDNFYISCAKTAISNRLASPSTAIWYNEKVVEQDGFGRILVTMTVESQNSFGGYRKAYYAVVISNCDPIKNTFSYHRLNGVQYSESLEFFNFSIDAAKKCSDWGIPPDSNNDAESD